MVTNPTMPPSNMAMQQNATFSLQACLVAGESNFMTLRKNTLGTHQVNARADTFHQSIPRRDCPKMEFPPTATFPPLEPPREPSAPPGTECLLFDPPPLPPLVGATGLIKGTGATARSGLVNVFARRKRVVAPLVTRRWGGGG